jgi:hypothetical protein
MGSFRKLKSSGRGDVPPPKPSTRRDVLYGVLDRYSEALAIVETVSNALQAAEDVRRCPHVGAEVATLRQAVRALTLVHEELDLAIPGSGS